MNNGKILQVERKCPQCGFVATTRRLDPNPLPEPVTQRWDGDYCILFTTSDVVDFRKIRVFFECDEHGEWLGYPPEPFVDPAGHLPGTRPPSDPDGQ